MVDFALGVESPLHRVIDYGVVLNGGIELELEDGQRQVVNEGDIGINRTCSHKWRNITSNGTLPERMLYILLDCNGVTVNEQNLEGFLGTPEKDYIGHSWG